MDAPWSLLPTFGQQLGLLTTIIVALAAIRRATGAVLRPHHQVIAGFVFGGAAASAMLSPVTLEPGLIFDARSAIIALSGPFAGPLAVLIAAVLAGGYRTSVGGAGLAPALFSLAGVALVSIGVTLAIRRSGREVGPRDLLVLALLVSGVNLLAFLLLPPAFLARVFHTLALPITLTNFVGIGLMGFILIEERRQRELQQAFADSAAQYRLLADNATDMIIQADLTTARRYVSPACRDLLGFEPEELMGARPSEGVHPEDAEALAQALQDVTTGRMEVGVTRQRHRHKDGRWIWTEAKLRVLRDGSSQPTGYVAVIRDISERVRLEECLHEQARTDALTGVYNRRAFEEWFNREWRRSSRSRSSFALLMLDVDYFKQFNDQFGHGQGDECLKQVAQVLLRDRRVTDCVARIGGEEFVILLPDTGSDGALVVAEAVRSQLEARQIAHPQSPFGVVTISVGVTVKLPGIGFSAADVLKASDQALYGAKQAGRNCVKIKSSGAGPYELTMRKSLGVESADKA